ncbi:MAG: ERAP1-like C-terminal domain-containing protein, partial [Burkholderiales bacterium]|nr:ERAP1-like C-terminal domain-containing protein [Burkholderiales bacterium]
GYGQFLLDPQSLEYALAHPEALQDELLRAQVFDSLWESVREAQLDPRRYIELALAWLPRERDDTTATLLLARLSRAYLRYSGAQARSAFAPAVEALLLSGLSGSGSASRRIAYLRALVETARSSAARARLRALYAGTQAIEGVPLRSRDRFRIASALLALGEPDALRLIADEAAREAGSEAQRYAFAAAAANPEPAAKAAYFRRFLTDQTLPESWIEEALVPFNVPEHEAATLPFLEQALQALPRLKRERRIFFVNGWLAAFLDGQSSPAALATVERFLASAELEPDLRLKVLEALDALARTVRIRGKFAG